MKGKTWFLLVAGLTVAAPTAKAQSDEAIAAAVALFMTPAGSFANVSTSALGDASTGVGFDYGRYTGEGNRNSYGAHLDWHGLRATVGVGTVSGGSENLYMAGLSGGRGLVSSGLLNVGAEAAVGYGRLKDDVFDETLNAFTAGVRLPLSLSSSTEGVSITPYVAPGAFFGRLSATGESESGFRGTLNGGVRFAFANGVSFDVGAQRIFIDEAETLFGAGLSFSRR